LRGGRCPLLLFPFSIFPFLYSHFQDGLARQAQRCAALFVEAPGEFEVELGECPFATSKSPRASYLLCIQQCFRRGGVL
jgi:hypothetical protein